MSGVPAGIVNNAVLAAEALIRARQAEGAAAAPPAPTGPIDFAFPAGSTTALTITPTAGDAGGSPPQPVVASLQIVRLA